MNSTDNITLILLAANLVFSIYGFQKPEIIDKYKLHVGSILHKKEYIRILTSGFLHGNFIHLFVNMLSLYFCGPSVNAMFSMIFGPEMGGLAYLATYFGSLFGGSALVLLAKKNQYEYAALGASGAISGIIFAFVYFIPDATFLLFFFLPCPAWLFAILFVGYSLFGMRGGLHNISHEGHLGGAIIGMLTAIILVPSLLSSNWWVALLLLVPSGAYLYLMIQRPDLLAQLMNGNSPFNFQKKRRGPRVVVTDHRGNRMSKQSPQEEMDELLDKVATKGYGGLTRSEKERLDELSGRLRERNHRNDKNNNP